MIKTSHTARRRLSAFAFAATTLLISAQFANAAKVDPRILAARTQMGTAGIEEISTIVKGVADQFAGTLKMNGKKRQGPRLLRCRCDYRETYRHRGESNR
jgi:hypothetical protein